MNRTISTVLAALALVAAAIWAGSAGASQSAPKPGFAPGTWTGTGILAGTAVDGPMKTVFSGRIRFSLTVSGALAARGAGTWAMTMKGSGPVSSVLKGAASLKVTGSGSDVRYSGTQKVSGTVTDGTLSRPISFSRPLAGRLVITRVGSCKVTGTSPMGDGLKFTWTATKGSGTCL